MTDIQTVDPNLTLERLKLVVEGRTDHLHALDKSELQDIILSAAALIHTVVDPKLLNHLFGREVNFR